MPPQPTGPRMAPQEDLYTVLLIVATTILLFGIIFMAVRGSQLFGAFSPSAGV